MKATGIVRRIDDLGRIVIPKEIRRTMRIRESDPLEIYTDRDGSVIFRKYSPMGELLECTNEITDAMTKTNGLSCIVCDRDSIISASGHLKRDLIEKNISESFKDIIFQRTLYTHTNQNTYVCDNVDAKILVSSPVISEGDVSGCIAFVSDNDTDTASQTESKLCQTMSSFLANKMSM